VLSVHDDTIRIFLHVLAATVWIGGQVVVAALVPVARAAGGRDLVRAVARRFQLVAWPAFAVLVATGIWNLAAVDVTDRSRDYLATLVVKLILVGVSGAAAGAHITVARRNPAVGGALAGVAALSGLATLFLGVLLRSGS
jgi:putative copper export protein